MAGGLTGSLDQWPLPELLNMLGTSRQSGRVVIESTAVEGAVFLAEGQLVHANAGPEAGVSALTTLFSLQEGSFCFEPRVPAPTVSLDQPLDQLIAQVQREAAERETIRRMIPSQDAVPRLARLVPDSPVTLQPVEWLAVSLSDGQRSVANLADAAGLDVPSAMRLLYGLGQRNLLAFSLEPVAIAAPPPPVAALVPVAAVEEEPEPVRLTVVESTPIETPVVAAQAPTAPPVATQPAPLAPAASYIHTGFFHDLSIAAASTLGPLAAVIVDDAIDALGYSRDAFPRQRAPQLVEVIAREIKDDRRRAEFQTHMLRLLQNRAA